MNITFWGPEPLREYAYIPHVRPLILCMDLSPGKGMSRFLRGILHVNLLTPFPCLNPAYPVSLSFPDPARTQHQLMRCSFHYGASFVGTCWPFFTACIRFPLIQGAILWILYACKSGDTQGNLYETDAHPVIRGKRGTGQELFIIMAFLYCLTHNTLRSCLASPASKDDFPGIPIYSSYFPIKDKESANFPMD